MNSLAERPAWTGHVNWLVEKWSEDAVDFARKRLEREGVTHIQDGHVVTRSRMRDALASRILGTPVTKAILIPRFIPITNGITSAELRRLVGNAEEYEEVVGNLLLNEGIQRLLDLGIAAGGTSYNNANAFIGVGDSTTVEAATQTDLQAATNHFYKGMNATFPSRASQTVSWQADFTSAEADFAWQEWTIAAGATGASGSGFTTGTTNLQRKVSSLGTKATGTWTMTGSATLS